MIENEDYQLIPVDVDNSQAWDIRILSGEFIETVIRFGNISIDGPNDRITFNFTIVFTEDDNLDINNTDLQNTAGLILGDLLDNCAKDGSLLLDDKK
jgi:hypothetical protein